MFTQQLLPEHAEAVSGADVVVFVDCSGTSAAGTVSNLSLQAAESLPRVITHHLEPAALLRLSLDLYARIPPRAFVVTIGGECFGLTDQLSRSVKAAVPKALLLIRQTLLDQVPQ
jgi:hydrogenase maturation protease